MTNFGLVYVMTFCLAAHIYDMILQKCIVFQVKQRFWLISLVGSIVLVETMSWPTLKPLS